MRVQISDFRLQIGGLLLCLLLGSVPMAAEVIDRVLAVVAGDLIMLSDVRAARDLGLVVPAASADPDRAVLSLLIDRALMLDEVDRYAPPEPSSAAIDRALADVRARFGSPAALGAVIARAGVDEPQLRAMLRQNLRISAYVAQRFSADTPERTQSVVTDWVASLRRRAEIIDLYTPSPP